MTTSHRPRSLVLALLLATSAGLGAEPAAPFGPDFPRLDDAATGEWWRPSETPGAEARLRFLDVPRDQTVAFALYTHERGTLKLTAQLYPLKPDEARLARLELFTDGAWREVAESPVLYPGWSAHFRIEDWDSTRDTPYRVRHGATARFEGLIRKDPRDKTRIVVASLSCNSSHDRGPRDEIVANLRRQDPDLLFFAGDQSYDHSQHTYAWLLWGWQFRDILRDRPTITIPDDHDIGQPNLWGEGGIRTDTPQGDKGGYYFPADYVRMVERCQTWHLPDPVDPRPVAQDIAVYFTRLRVGGIDFAILEDRKFKSGPNGKIPPLGPRPDHVVTDIDVATLDVPGLELLGERQLAFLHSWGQDWEGAAMKAVLSQTAFAGAVHLHGSRDNRLLADLDSNAWPQSGRRAALAEIRRALAVHLCGDQHLAVVVQHGIDAWRDGPFGFTNPAIVNTIYGRWWWPLDERPGARPIAGSPLPWTGDYLDGLGNRITMHAYANPPQTDQLSLREEVARTRRADGYGLVRFDKSARTITFECWPRFADVRDGDAAQFPGWPMTVRMEDNDGRAVAGHLPELRISGADDPVVQVIAEATGEILYTRRITGTSFRPPVFGNGKHTVKIGRDRPDGATLPGLEPSTAAIDVRL